MEPRTSAPRTSDEGTSEEGASEDATGESAPGERARVAVLGATGLVGREIVRLLEQRAFPVSELVPLASARGEMRTIDFRGERVPVRVATVDELGRCDLVLSSAGGAVSRELLPGAGARGAVCVDNTSAFRMDRDVPLVVPEVNAERLAAHHRPRGIVANPNCSTIQLVTALKPLHDAATVRSVVVSTYQSASGAGRAALDELRASTAGVLRGDEPEPERFPRRIAFNAIPDIGGIGASGDTTEERKMIDETRRILAADVAVDATCVRIPTFVGHAESVLVQTERGLTVDEARALLAGAPGVVLADGDDYATPAEIAGSHPVHVGRVRASRAVPGGIQLWIVADNLLKGAALNAVQIAEELLALGVTREDRAALSAS